MAIAGKSNVIPQPGRRKVGAKLRSAPEASAQTFPRGAILIRTAGSVKMGATGGAQSTGIVGFAASSGRSGSADGVYTTPYFVLEMGEAIRIVLGGTWTGSAHRGATAGFSMNTAGVVQLQTTGSGCGTIIKEVPWDNGNAVADGDSNVVVYFLPADTAIAG